MALSNLIIYIVLGLVVLFLIVFPEFRRSLKTLIGGFLGLFIEDWAKTPEGAAATFQQAIEEQQNIYNKASDTFQDLSGALRLRRDELETEKRSLVVIEKDCERFAREKDIPHLSIKADERESCVDNIRTLGQAIEKLEPLVAEAKEVMSVAEIELKKLKKSKKSVVMEMQLNNSINESYSKVDKLKKTNTTSKLLEQVQDGLNDSKQKAAGAKQVYENSAETKSRRANQAARKLENDDYVNSLLKKYESEAKSQK